MCAKKRMFSLQIVDTDAFLDMPISSQLLYFHLSMRADDEGFVNNPKKIMKIIGTQEDDFKILLAKRFILQFNSGIIVIKHWLIHNNLRTDRIKETSYLEEKKSLIIKENGSYSENDNQMSTKCPPSIDKIRLDKTRLDKNSIVLQSEDCETINILLNAFKEINPTINFGNKTQRGALEELVKKFGYDKTLKTIEYAVSVQGQKFAPTITTPYQLKNKLGDLMVYYKKETGSPRIVKI